MKLVDQLDESRIQVGLRAKTKGEALRAVAKLFAKGHAGVDAEKAFVALQEREDISRTGIGNGLAVPHGKGEGLKRPAYVLAVVPDGIQWDAADGGPVKILAAMLAPEKSAADPVKLLARLVRVFRDAGLRERLVAARGAAQVLDALRAGEKGA